MKAIYPLNLRVLATIVSLVILSVSKTHADLLGDLQKKASEASQAIDEAKKALPGSKPAATPKPPAKTDGPPTAPPKNAPAGSPNRSSLSLANTIPADTNELAFPILPDGSFFISSRINGKGSDPWRRNCELLFGDGPVLSQATRSLLGAAHGVRDDKVRDRKPNFEAIIKKTEAYTRAQDDFERRDILAAKKTIFEETFNRIKQVTNVTALLQLPWGFHYSLKDETYLHYPDRNYSDRSESLDRASLSVGFRLGSGQLWVSPEAFAFPADRAEKINAEMKGNDETLGVAILIHGVFCTQEEFDDWSKDSSHREAGKRVHLLVRMTSAESFLVLTPKSKSNRPPRLISMGRIDTTGGTKGTSREDKTRPN